MTVKVMCMECYWQGPESELSAATIAGAEVKVCPECASTELDFLFQDELEEEEMFSEEIDDL